MDKPAPKIAGRPLVALSWLLRSRVVGAPLRNSLGSLVIEPELAKIDFEAEGSPAPFYAPPPYKPAGGAGEPAPQADETSAERRGS